MNNKLSEEKCDIIKEVVSIGAGNAATALSQLVKQKVDIIVPKVNFSAIEKAQEIFGPPETPVATVNLELTGDISGAILFSFEEKDAYLFADMLTGKGPGVTKKLDEMSESALKESAGILSGAYLSALSKLLNMKLLFSSPVIALDMAGAIVDNILIETSREADHILVINTEIRIVNEKINAYFFFVPDKESLEKIIIRIS